MTGFAFLWKIIQKKENVFLIFPKNYQEFNEDFSSFNITSFLDVLYLNGTYYEIESDTVEVIIIKISWLG